MKGHVNRKIVCLLFIGLVVSSAALAEPPLIPVALMILLQSVRRSTAQEVEVTIPSYAQSSHVFFSSSAVRMPEHFRPKSLALTENCSKYWDLLQPTPKEAYKDKIRLKDAEGSSDSPEGAEILEKFQQMLSMARADGGSTRQMIDLAFGKKYLPFLEVNFVDKDEQFGVPEAAAVYDPASHTFEFSPEIALEWTAEELHRTFIHETIHGVNALKHAYAFPVVYLANKTVLDQTDNRRFSAMFKTKKTNVGPKFEGFVDANSIHRPYFGEAEKEAFDREYEICIGSLEKVYWGIRRGLDLNGIDIETTPGKKINAKQVLSIYQKHHVSALRFQLDAFDPAKYPTLKKDLETFLEKNRDLTLPIPGTDFMGVAKVRRHQQFNGMSAFFFSYADTTHHFVATFARYTRFLKAYSPERIDAEKVSLLKEHYKAKFIATICPGLEEFFLGTNQRFKEDLIEACETNNNPTEVSPTL